MFMKRKWLTALLLLMLAGCPMNNPKDIEDLLHTMNETKGEFSIPDEGDKGDGNRPLMEIDPVQPTEPCVPGSEKTLAGNSSLR
jgi:hypothetical protein